MDRFVALASRSLALTACLMPVTLCFGDTPVPTPCDSQSPCPSSEITAVSIAPADNRPAEVPLFRHQSYPAAWTAAQESNKPILVYISMPNCPHCNRMLDRTFCDPAISALVKGSFETMQASRYTHTVLVEKLHVKWYPTTVLVGSNNKILDTIEGYVDTGTFKHRLQLGIAAATNTTQTR